MERMTAAGIRPKPAGGFELWAWFFMRVSGLLLLFLALGHLAVMHLINSVDVIDYDFVAMRFMTPFWRAYDLLMLTLALLHGVNGARTLIDDYVHPEGWRIAALSALYVVGGILWMIGSLILVTFQP